MLDYVRNDITTYYKMLKKPILVMVFLLIAEAVNNRGSKMNGLFDVILYYTMVIYVIMETGDDSRYLLLGVSTAFFLSEFWEIPIYIWQIVSRGTYADYDIMHKIYLVIRFILKIITIVYVKIEMDSIGLNAYDLLVNFLKFSVFYVPGVFLFFMFNNSNVINGMNFNWAFRLLCFGVVIQYLYKQGINIIDW